jgi:hypothetical protein
MTLVGTLVNVPIGGTTFTTAPNAVFNITGTNLENSGMTAANFIVEGIGAWSPADNTNWVMAGNPVFEILSNTTARLTVPIEATALTGNPTRTAVMTVRWTINSATHPLVDVPRTGTAMATIRQSSVSLPPLQGGGGDDEDPNLGSWFHGQVDSRPPREDDGKPGEDDPRRWVGVVVTPAHLLFDDVRATDWFHEAVGIVAAYGLFHGTAPRVFEPQTPMSRAMFAQVLANLTGANTAAFAALEPVFSDVQPGAWYYGAVQWGYHAGIISGVGEGRFAPNDDVTREQMAALLNRYVNVNRIALPSNAARTFTDAAQISWWAADDVAAIQRAGIIGGYPEGDYRPQRSATRAEVASIFAQFLKVTGIHAEIAQEMFE